jgi:hypothetical protein
MVVHEKLRKLLSGDDVKAIQKIVIAVGHICVKETSSSLLNISLELIFSLSRSKVGTIFFFSFFSAIVLVYSWTAHKYQSESLLCCFHIYIYF